MGVEFFLFTPVGAYETEQEQEAQIDRLYATDKEEEGVECWYAMKMVRHTFIDVCFTEFIPPARLIETGTEILVSYTLS